MEITNRRVSIRQVTPQVEDGRFLARRSLGEPIEVHADVFGDSHDKIAAAVRWRFQDTDEWHEAPMAHLVNDRWRARFEVDRLGRVDFTVVGWVDRFGTWQRDFGTKVDADVATEVDFLAGSELVGDVVGHAPEGSEDRERLAYARDVLGDGGRDPQERLRVARSRDLADLVARHDDRRHATTYEPTLTIRVDRERARFSSWYELFPRSTSPDPDRHGTFDDVIARLPYVQSMGFNVLYLPPIHPIGRDHRKGRNNSLETTPDDPGSPWAIGSTEGGHRSIHPQLGTLDDFKRLVRAAEEHRLEVALDIAFQCAPDHPWVSEHPEWFKRRPDGSIQYAENPPKKYQDIYPLNFETEDPEGLWNALHGVFQYWIDQGVRIFRVDNPHTKSFPFWHWVIDRITLDHPDVIFLAEAFTRPKVMYELAKVGFTQSYTYFAWRTEKWEIEQYYNELFRTGVVDYFRPNSWPNTPDILTEQLQHGGRPAFVQRLILAATLTANFGIYGPPFELMLSEARPGAEEYLDNEKYEIHHWDLDRSPSLRELIARVNWARNTQPALQQDRNFRFHHIDNDQIVVFSKRPHDGGDTILVVVSLDVNWTQSGFTWLDMEALGLDADARFQVHDLIGNGRYLWQGPRNYVELDPGVSTGHIFAVHDLHRTERDFPGW